MKIVIPIVIIIIASILGGIYYFFIRKKATSPAPAPVQVSVPAPAPILKYPQLTDGSSNTWTISGRPYGNGTYIVTSSNTTDTVLQAYRMFNGIINQADSSHWRSSVTPSPVYNDTTGVYIGSQSLGGINGDWVNIKLPNPIALKSYTLYARNDYDIDISGVTKWWQNRSPKEFVILGSNDGTTWNIVDDRRGNNKAPNWTSVSQSFTTNNTTKYSNYAIVITKVGNDDVTTSKSVACIQEWELYGN